MPRRRIGQEMLVLGPQRCRGRASLDEVAGGLDRTGAPVGGDFGLCQGGTVRPPVPLFRALLLATWHELSGVRSADFPRTAHSVSKQGVQPQPTQPFRRTRLKGLCCKPRRRPSGWVSREGGARPCRTSRGATSKERSCS